MADNNDIRDEFSPLLDDELPPNARDAVERQLAQDSELLRELDAMRKVDELYRSLPRAAAPADLSENVQERLREKSKPAASRPRRIPAALYSGLAAAAIFTVLIGGVVIRQEFIVSPSAEDRLMEAASEQPLSAAERQVAAPSVAADEASEEEGVAAFADAPEIAAPNDADDVQLQQGALGGRAMERDQVAENEPQFRQEAAENAPATASPRPDTAAGFGEHESKDEAAPMPQAEVSAPAAAPPPPTLGESGAGGGIETDEAPARPAELADAEAREMKAEVSALRKRSNAVKEVAGRQFDEREDGWYQRGYNGEPTQIVRRGSEAIATLSASIPRMQDVLELKGAVVLKQGDTWYRIPAAPEE